MKKSILFFFTAIIILLSACSMLDPILSIKPTEDSDQNVSIVGTWVSTDGDEKFLFAEDGSFKNATLFGDKSFVFYLKGTYSVIENKIKTTPTHISFDNANWATAEDLSADPLFGSFAQFLAQPSEWTYSVTSTTLIMTMDGESVTYNKSEETDVTITPENTPDNPDDDSDTPDNPIDNPDDTDNDNPGDNDDDNNDPIITPDDPEAPPAEPSIIGNWTVASADSSDVFFFSDFGTLLCKETTDEGVTFSHGEYTIEDDAIHFSFIARGPRLDYLMLIKNSEGNVEPEEYDGNIQFNNNELTISAGELQLVLSKSEEQPCKLDNDYVSLISVGNNPNSFSVGKISFTSEKMQSINYTEKETTELPAFDYVYNPLISALSTSDSNNPYFICFFEDEVLNLCVEEDFYMPFFPVDRDSNFSLTNKIYNNEDNDLLVYTGDYITLYLNSLNIKDSYYVDYWETRKELALRYYKINESLPDQEYLKNGVFNFDYKENEDGTITVSSKIMPNQTLEELVKSYGIVSFVGENETYMIPFRNEMVINGYWREYYVEDGKLTAVNGLGKKTIYDYSLSFQGEVPTLTLTNESESYTLYYNPLVLNFTKCYDL